MAIEIPFDSEMWFIIGNEASKQKQIRDAWVGDRGYGWDFEDDTRGIGYDAMEWAIDTGFILELNGRRFRLELEVREELKDS